MSYTPTADELRNHLVDEIIATPPLPQQVEHLLQTVHHETPLPAINLPDADSDQAVSIKDNPSDPSPLSCASAPTVIAMMSPNSTSSSATTS